MNNIFGEIFGVHPIFGYLCNVFRTKPPPNTKQRCKSTNIKQHNNENYKKNQRNRNFESSTGGRRDGFPL
jgi:hypothetical protein